MAYVCVGGGEFSARPAPDPPDHSGLQEEEVKAEVDQYGNKFKTAAELLREEAAARAAARGGGAGGGTNSAALVVAQVAGLGKGGDLQGGGGMCSRGPGASLLRAYSGFGVMAWRGAGLLRACYGMEEGLGLGGTGARAPLGMRV